MAMDSLLDEVNSLADAKVLRMSFTNMLKKQKNNNKNKKSSNSCILCKQAGRPYQHYLSLCKYLPEEDRQYMTEVRLTMQESDNKSDGEDDCPQTNEVEHNKLCVVASWRRVSTKQSPVFKAFYKHHPLQLILDTGAEISMIRASTAKYIGANITKSKQSALQADGVNHCKSFGKLD